MKKSGKPSACEPVSPAKDTVGANIQRGAGGSSRHVGVILVKRSELHDAPRVND